MESLGCKFRIFTDNIIIAVPVTTSSDLEEELGIVITSLAEFQLHLARNGYFVRGGVSYGPFVMDEDVTFGGALLDAYQLESQKAVFPRIVFSENLAQVIKHHLGFYTNSYKSPHNGYLLRDVDGVIFLNYLYNPLGWSDGEELPEILREHRVWILERLKQFAGIPTIWAKYKWLADYHDFFVETWTDQDISEELLLGTEVIRAKPELLVPPSPFSSDAQDVLALLLGEDRPLAPKDIVLMSGLDAAASKKAIRELSEAKRVEPIGRRGGRKYRAVQRRGTDGGKE